MEFSSLPQQKNKNSVQNSNNNPAIKMFFIVFSNSKISKSPKLLELIKQKNKSLLLNLVTELLTFFDWFFLLLVVVFELFFKYNFSMCVGAE